MRSETATLRPHARAFLDGLAALGAPKFAAMPYAKARALMNAAQLRLDSAREPVARVTDLTISGPHGPIALRAYLPDGDVGGAVAFYHGGGFVIGDIETYDPAARRLANAAGALVVSVAYHLAPEFPYPAPLDDASAALLWIAEHARELGAPAGRLAVAGDSAGGFLATAAALVARDRGTPRIEHQALVYPKVDALGRYASFERFGDGLYLTRELMQWFDAAIHPSAASRTLPYASPIRESLAGLPPATIVLAECDPLVDEGLAYARALVEAGVAADVRVFEGLFHGFFSMGSIFSEAREAALMLGASLRAAFARAAR